MKLDKDEQALLDAYERGEFKPVPNMKRRIAQHRAYAAAHVEKKKLLNLRITQSDFLMLQRRAAREGLAYQDLATSVLHKFVAGNQNAKVA